MGIQNGGTSPTRRWSRRSRRRTSTTTSTTPTATTRTARASRTSRTGRPSRPPGPPPTGAALLAQLVAAMQAAAAGLPAPGPGPAPPPLRVKISPPIFKGLPGERPEAHLLRANDWMDTYNILPVNKPANFKHTLDHLAREWYDSLTFPIAWDDLQQRFSWYFSTQGRSIKHLHDKW